MNIILVRHGQTDWNVKDLLQGRTDIELNENGKKQAIETAQKLLNINIDVIYVSPLKRKENIEKEINKEIAEKGLILFVFVITDIVNSNSEAIVLGERTDAISKEYELNDNIAVMPGVVSRKKQILPLVEKNI